ncbi:hypothetical protein M3D00_17655, partial [Dietzia cinnamea]
MTLRRWTLDNWVTINFIPTPGWTNTFTTDDGGKFTSPCPGVLVQELRSVTRYRQVPGHDGEIEVTSSVSSCPEPYDTRVVASDIEYGYLEPVVDTGN